MPWIPMPTGPWIPYSAVTPGQYFKVQGNNDATWYKHREPRDYNGLTRLDIGAVTMARILEPKVLDPAFHCHPESLCQLQTLVWEP